MSKSDEESVRDRHPEAVAVCNEAVRQMGQSHPVEPGYWASCNCPYLGQTELGRGPNRAAAWADAAKKLS